MNTPFEITKEEVLNLAAQKLVDQYADDEYLSEAANKLMQERISKIIANKFEQRIEEYLAKEMELLLSKEIVPVDIWGDKAGKPTTLRASLHERAKEFWELNVDESGKPYSSWGGKPRHQHLMEKILQDEFAKAVKQNAEVIISEFKKAITADSVKLVTEHINRLIKTK